MFRSLPLRRPCTAFAAFIALVFSLPCAAELVFGADFGLGAPFFTGNSQFGLAGSAEIGVHPDKFPVLLDFRYLTTGEMRDSEGGPKSIFTGKTVTLGYSQRLGRSHRLMAQARAGYYNGTSRISDLDIPSKREFAEGVTAGIGFEYRFLPTFGMHFGVDALFDVQDFSGQQGTELKGRGSSDVFLITVGLVLGTGNPVAIADQEQRRAEYLRRREATLEKRRVAAERQEKMNEARQLAEAREREAAAARELEEIRARERARAEAAAAVVAAPPATVAPPAAPVEQAAASPVAAARASLAPGQPARIRAGTYARARATPEGDAVKGLDAGVTVTLKVMLRNNTGAWWYVYTPDDAGWVRDADLEPVTP